MSKLLQSDLVLMGPTKYFCGDCTIGGALMRGNHEDGSRYVEKVINYHTRSRDDHCRWRSVISH
jgi:hypothetical protein